MESSNKRKILDDNLPLKPEKEIKLDTVVNPVYFKYKNVLRCAFQQAQQQLDCIPGAEICWSPFKHGILPAFIDDNLLRKVKQELTQELKFHFKNNDLYTFFQSEDFKYCDLENIKLFRESLIKNTLPLIQEITGFELYSGDIDLTASKYLYSHVLLCHDDQLCERRVAFILYLTENWKEDYGGTLDIFDTDNNDQPAEIVKKILPRWNHFIFFEVTPFSYHQVSEVLTQEEIRWSVGGWFKGKVPKFSSKLLIERPLEEIRCWEVDVEEDIIREWINPMYLDLETQIDIQEEFKETSEINLIEFLLPPKYLQLCEALNNARGWKLIGPANRRKFEILDRIDRCPVIKEFINVMQSETIFLTLSNITGLKFHPLVEEESSDDSSETETDESNQSTDESDSQNANQSSKETPKKFSKSNKQSISDPRCSFQIRQWRKGFYSLIHDNDPQVMSDEPKLDVILHLNHDYQTKDEQGGFISFITKDEDEELLSVTPESNFLSIVYMDSSTVRFVKYLNDSHPGMYHDINFVFRE